MDTIRIIEAKNDWEAVLKEFEAYDFYHTYDYHQISKSPDEAPLLVVYEEEDVLVALPLLLRKIFDTDFYDATSVYGYAGPLTKNVDEYFDNNRVSESLREYFREKNIISVFSRLNPYIPHQDVVLKGIGEVRSIGNIVNIDLTKSLDEQRSAYRRDTRSRVNKARRLCTVRKAETEQDIKSFIAIYNETMEKLNADDSYFFKEGYFYDFLKCNGFQTDILLAIHNETGDVTAASMFVKTNNIIQYHLSGTRSDYMKIAPSRLLLDEMRIIGTQEGYTYFNLGGGYQSREDALFEFKSSFSNDHKSFKVWTFVVDVERYDALTKISGAGESDFFPAYRAK
ncbi:MAG TPA: GNAT family N-acetyltransferase [Eudoraea sp.]|nr:GNAT family N-acetyltransferase [Eudoraea sp.]